MECFDRDVEANRLWRLFVRGRDVLMLGPRRMGKTVLLERLEREAATHGFRAVTFDVEGYREVKDFFRVMCSSIQEELGSGQALVTSFTERLRRVVRGAEDLDGDWRNLLLKTEWDLFADHLLGELEDAEGATWLFLVDEITIFTKAIVDGPGGVSSASDFLYKLRQLCRRHRKVRWLFTGSIGLDTIARRHGFEGALVDLEIFPLRPFDADTAARFLHKIAATSETSFSDAAVDRICTRLGWLSPYYLEKIAESACDLASPGAAVDVATADSAADDLLDLAHRTYWSTWREHLDKNFPEPERTRLFTLLQEVALGDGASVDTLLLALNRGGEPVGEVALRGYLDSLEADGYLAADANRTRYRFLMGLLREWWLRYVAVASRETAGG